MIRPDYTPHPIDTSDIQLSEALNQLIELIAHNVHDTWAQSRLNEGWT
jgi:ryanodine receptor 2